MTAPSSASRRIKPKQAALLLGLTARHLARLADERVLSAVIGAGGQREYLWPDIRDQYAEHREQIAVAEALKKVGPRADSPEAAKARLANAQAAKVEMELARLRSESVSVALATAQYRALAQRLVPIVNSMKGRYRDRCVGLTEESVDAVLDDLEDTLRRALHQAVSAIDDGFEDPEDDGNAEDLAA